MQNDSQVPCAGVMVVLCEDLNYGLCPGQASMIRRGCPNLWELDALARTWNSLEWICLKGVDVRRPSKRKALYRWQSKAEIFWKRNVFAVFTCSKCEVWMVWRWGMLAGDGGEKPESLSCALAGTRRACEWEDWGWYLGWGISLGRRPCRRGEETMRPWALWRGALEDSTGG